MLVIQIVPGWYLADEALDEVYDYRPGHEMEMLIYDLPITSDLQLALKIDSAESPFIDDLRNNIATVQVVPLDNI